MEEGEEHRDLSYQKQYYAANYLQKEIFMWWKRDILWWDLGLKWKLNQ